MFPTMIDRSYPIASFWISVMEIRFNVPVNQSRDKISLFKVRDHPDTKTQPIAIVVLITDFIALIEAHRAYTQ